MCETTLSFIFYFTGFLLVITLINIWYLTTSKSQEYGIDRYSRNNSMRAGGNRGDRNSMNAGGMFNYGETLATKEERQTLIDNISYYTLGTDQSM